MMTEQDVKDKFGVELPSLDNAEVKETKPTELHFDRNDYTDFGELAYKIASLPNKPGAGKVPSCKSLSVNGKVIQDRMDKYLEAQGESSSALKEALKTPRHYLVYKNMPRKEESHFTLGTFIHSAFLEPTKFAKVKTIPDDCNKNTKVGLQNYIQYYWRLLGVPQDTVLAEQNMNELKEIVYDLEQSAKEQGYTFIDAEKAQIVKFVQATYFTYAGGIIPRLVANGRREVSMYGVDPSTGLKVKIRPDCMLFEEQVGANLILSVKTTSATSLEAFMMDAARYRYELAEGMYLQVASEITGRKFTGTIMLIAQTCDPYLCALLWLDAEDLACGKYKYAQAMDVVAQCKRSDNWPGYETFAEEGASGIIQVHFPEWIKKELKPQYIPAGPWQEP